MNPRINDLMYQAGLTAQGCWDSMDDYDQEAILKFAQLIVQECAQVCNDIDAEYGGEDVLATWCAKVIEERLGVEQ